MNKYSCIALSLVLLFPLSCATVDPNMTLTTTEAEHSTLVIYREKAKFIGAGAYPFIGTEAGYFAQLENGQYIELAIDSGENILLSKMDIYSPNELPILLEPNATQCVLATYNYGVSLTLGANPSASSKSNGFSLKETVCPSQEELSQLVKIEVGHTVPNTTN